MTIAATSKEVFAAAGTTELSCTISFLTAATTDVTWKKDGSAVDSTYTVVVGDASFNSGTQITTLSVPVTDDSRDDISFTCEVTVDGSTTQDTAVIKFFSKYDHILKSVSGNSP